MVAIRSRHNEVDESYVAELGTVGLAEDTEV